VATNARRNGPYAPLSVGYYRDPAIIRAGEKAEILYLRALAFTNDAQTDGHIDDTQVPLFTVGLGTLKPRIAALEREGLWLRNGSGWHVRNWAKWNRTKAEIEDKRRADSERKRANTP
jgi:hypothetical protein